MGAGGTVPQPRTLQHVALCDQPAVLADVPVLTAQVAPTDPDETMTNMTSQRDAHELAVAA